MEIEVFFELQKISHTSFQKSKNRKKVVYIIFPISISLLNVIGSYALLICVKKLFLFF